MLRSSRSFEFPWWPRARGHRAMRSLRRHGGAGAAGGRPRSSLDRSTPTRSGSPKAPARRSTASARTLPRTIRSSGSHPHRPRASHGSQDPLHRRRQRRRLEDEERPVQPAELEAAHRLRWRPPRSARWSSIPPTRNGRRSGPASANSARSAAWAATGSACTRRRTRVTPGRPSPAAASCWARTSPGWPPAATPSSSRSTPRTPSPSSPTSASGAAPTAAPPSPRSASATAAATGLPGGVTYDLVGDADEPGPALHQRPLRQPLGGLNGVYRSTTPEPPGRRSATRRSTRSSSAARRTTSSSSVREQQRLCRDRQQPAAWRGSSAPATAATTWTAMDLPKTGPNNVGIHPGAQGAIHLSIAADPVDANIVLHRRRPPAVPRRGGPGAAAVPQQHRRPELLRPPLPLRRVAARGQPVHPAHPHRHRLEQLAARRLAGDDLRCGRETCSRPTTAASTGAPARGTATGDWFSINGDLQVSEQHDASYDTLAEIVFVGTQDNDDPHQN